MSDTHTESSSEPPALIAPEEPLARSVSGSKFRDRTVFDAFLPGRNAKREGEYRRDLSIDRCSYLDQDTAVLFGECRANQRHPRRTFFGWAILSAEKACKDGREVVSSKIDKNPAHADILLPLDTTTDKKKRNRQATLLAQLSTLKPRPEGRGVGNSASPFTEPPQDSQSGLAQAPGR